MRFKRFFAVVALLLMIFSLSACKGDKKKDTPKEEELVNILEQPDDYVGKFKVPSSKDVEKGSTLSIITYINEDVDKIETATKTASSDITVAESFAIDCYGINIEIFKCEDNSPMLIEARDSGKITFRSSQGKIMAEKLAATNGNYVMLFSSSMDSNGEDKTEKNNEIIEKFKSLELK